MESIRTRIVRDARGFQLVTIIADGQRKYFIINVCSSRSGECLKSGVVVEIKARIKEIANLRNVNK